MAVVDFSVVALRSLLEVSRRGTMTAAAEALGYTPGAVSQHIASLSRAVGRPVVEQAGRRVKLTDTGLVVLAHAQRVIESDSQVRQELAERSAPVAGTLTVGAFGSSSVLLGAVFARMKQSYPELALRARELRETNTDNASLAVLRSDVDVALSLDYPDAPIERGADLHHGLLATEHFGVAGLAPGEGGDPVSLSELAKLDWVIPPPDSNYGLAVRAACRRAGFEPRAVQLVTDTTMSLRLAAAGLGITLATPLMLRFAAGESCHWRALREPIARELLLVVRQSNRQRPPVTAFASELAEVVEAFESAAR